MFSALGLLSSFCSLNITIQGSVFQTDCISLVTINHLSVLSVTSGLLTSHIIIIINKQNAKKKKQSNNEMVLLPLTSVQLCVIRRVTTQMGALDGFRVALLHFAYFLNRSNCLRRGKKLFLPLRLRSLIF